MTLAGPKWIVCQDVASLSQTAVTIFLDLYRKTLLREPIFTVLLSGGKTPDTIYSLLAESSNQGGVDWNKIHLFWGDERFVPSNHPESNFGTLKVSLISRINIPPENVHPIPTDGVTPQEAAIRYENHLKAFFNLDENAFPRFSLILLGVGEDGHTASLFPGSPELDEKKRWVVSSHVKSLKNQRITVTLPVLNEGHSILVLASGEKKAEVMKRAIESNSEPFLPIQRIHPSTGEITFLMDAAAASRL
ncbi:MAG: 6-phosphogluconolactonase [Nitrospirae bacterium]|nr:6-phosphogluconolactonase [Nitrospirota bacterium]MBI3595384.1 6-phosphogluconolactonase [Nitrospirota bacterium]